ncbi:MAG: o-succinylbenzoate--CoA ligase [Bacteroidota bacterium]|nr:o-succinylbenzoate--CoA ligase [Bacteroidota bacterium]
MPTKAELYVPASLFSVENPLREASAKVAGYMVRNRISRVGICLEPGWQAVEALLGCMHAGVSAGMLSMRWPGAAVNQALGQLGIKYVLTKRTDLKVECLDPAVCYVETPLTGNASSHKGVATIVYTSGSSATPRAVAHSLENHITSAQSACAALDLGSSDRWLLSLPLWHVSGISIVFRCSIAGATIVIPDPGMSLMEALSSYQITHVSMVPTQLIRALEQAQKPPRHLRAVFVGGGPLPQGVLKTAVNRGWPIRSTYGMTETSSMVTLSQKNPPPGSSGHALQGNELKIAGDGEILVRSPSICLGYLNNDAIVSVADDDGWLHTGDLGRLDENGELYVLGRKDNMFISGGENISPEEIEFALCDVRGVQKAVVVPVPDPEFGQRPVAFIKGSAKFKDLERALNRELPRFKIPKYYPWPDSAGSHSLKPDRKLFTELAARLQENS